MDNPLISVIIPCYNTEKFMKTCFDCIDNQTYKNLQIIFVDDGSKDNTLSLIKEYCQKHPSYMYLTDVNHGVSHARNVGLENIKGEYFAFCDADDVIEPIHYENLLHTLLRANADVGICGFSRVSSNKKNILKNLKLKDSKLEVYDTEQALKQYFSQEKFDYILVNKIYKTSILRQTQAHFIEDTRYGEESYFVYHYFCACKKIAYSNVKTYYYVLWKSSLMHTQFNESRLALVSNLDKLIEKCRQEKPSIVSYVHSMRAGYICGLLYFIKKSTYREMDKINSLVESLKEDCKHLKTCKEFALYKRLFIPIVPKLVPILIKNKK